MNLILGSSVIPFKCRSISLAYAFVSSSTVLLLRLEFGLRSSYAVSLFRVDDCLSLS